LIDPAGVLVTADVVVDTADPAGGVAVGAAEDAHFEPTHTCGGGFGRGSVCAQTGAPSGNAVEQAMTKMTDNFTGGSRPSGPSLTTRGHS